MSAAPVFLFPKNQRILTAGVLNSLIVESDSPIEFFIDGVSIGFGTKNGSDYALDWMPTSTDFDVDLTARSADGSSTTVKVAVAEQNRFATDLTTWSRSNFTVTGGVADPFGGTSAYEFTATANSSPARHAITATVSTPSTNANSGFELWVKYNPSLPVVCIYPTNGNAKDYCYVNLQNGDTTGNFAYAKIVEANGDWKRIWFSRADGIPTDTVSVYATKTMGSLTDTTDGSERLQIYAPRSVDGPLPFTDYQLMQSRFDGVKNGAQVWQTRTPYLGSPTDMNKDWEVDVVLPSSYDPAKQYRVIYVLQPVPGTAGGILNGLTTLQSLGIADKYNAILAYMPLTGLSVAPWFGSKSDGTYALDSHFLDVVSLVDDKYSTIENRDGRVLLGFSKTGWAATSFLLRDPETFGYAGAWDAPWDLAFNGPNYGQPSAFGTEAQFLAYSPEALLGSHIDSINDKDRLVIGGSAVFDRDLASFKAMLDARNLPYSYFYNKLPNSTYHNWSVDPSGWTNQFVAELMRLARQTITVSSQTGSIAGAMANAGYGDLIQLVSGYSNEAATISIDNLAITGDATSTGISLTLGNRVTSIELDGLAPINVTGNGAANTILGNAGANTLIGGDGDDFLHGGGGADILDGGIGVDTADYSDKTVAVIVALNGSNDVTAYVGGTAEDTLRNIENLTGGTGDDSLTGDAQANILIGGAENDVLRGGDGADVLDGGIGVDTADYSDKTTAVVVTLNGSINATAFVGGAAEDTLRNIENLTGGAGNDALTGDNLANVLIGGAGNDVLRGGGGSDVLDGGADVDTADYSDKTGAVAITLNGSSDATAFVGGTAEDTLRNIENLTGGAGNDTLKGDALANALIGGAGNDVLQGGGGADVLDGGIGADTADYSDKAVAVVVALNGSNDATAYVGGAAEDTLRNIENLTGGAGDDTIKGDAQANILIGGAGNDVLRGGDGADVLDGGIGVDTADYSDKTTAVVVTLNGSVNATAFVGGAAEDTLLNIENLTGGAGNDTLTGDTLANTLIGGAGNDVLRGGGGADVVDGGADIDTADYSDKTTAVSVALNGSSNVTAFVGGVAEDTLRNIENVTGGAGNDTLTGDALLNVLVGGAGNDVLQGGGGADVLDGGIGVDTVDYSDKTASVMITLNGSNDATAYVGGTAEDTLRNIENVTGGAGDDTLTGDALANVLTGGSGNDVLRGGAGRDTLDGGIGVDTVDYSDMTTAIFVALNGANTTTAFVGGIAEDTLRNIENVTGGAGNDTLTGDNFINVLIGGAGNDVLRGSGGADVLDGGADIDTADYSDKTTAVAITLNGSSDSTAYVGGSAEDTLRNIENLTGGAGSDTLIGDSFNNVLVGGSGNDVLRGGGGTDVLDGGIGLDTADYSDKSLTVAITLNGSSDSTAYVGGTAEDTLRNIENVTGGAGDDTLTGDALANVLTGGAGKDVLRGGGGRDTLDGGLGMDTADYSDKTAAVTITLNGANATTALVGGVGEDTLRNIENLTGGTGNDKLTGDALANVLIGGDGDDLLRGGGGSDVLDGGSGVDTADYSDKTSAVSITLNGANDVVAYVGGVAEDRLRNIENLTGGSGGDTLTGDDLANMLIGGGGNDMLRGGLGADVLDGGSGVDTASYSDFAAAISIALNGANNTTAYVGGTAKDTLRNIENLTGGTGDDTLVGDSFANVLTGGAGNDFLQGNDGRDVLTGGAGADTFVIGSTGGANYDQITDFSSADGDKVGFQASQFGLTIGSGLNQDGSLNAGYFEAGASLRGTHAEFFFSTSSKALYWDADGAGGSSAVALTAINVPAATDPTTFLKATDFRSV